MKQNETLDYVRLLNQVRQRVALAQQKAIYSANEEMLHMYWDIGEILQKKPGQRRLGEKDP